MRIDTIRLEMSRRLRVIIEAAQIMQSDIIGNNLSYIRKQMEEIEQYSGLVRIDVDLLTGPNERKFEKESDRDEALNILKALNED